MEAGCRAGPDAADQVQPVSVVLVEISSRPRQDGSVFSGRKKSGGLLRSVSPKKPGGVIPTTVNGFSLRLKTLPITDGSDSVLLLP